MCIKCVIVKFDCEKAGMEQRKNYASLADKYKDSNGTPIFRQRLRYFLSSSEGNAHAVQATVFQFPIKVAFALERLVQAVSRSYRGVSVE